MDTQDVGCSEAGRTYPPSARIGHCPVRGAPCVHAYLVGTITQLKKTFETYAGDVEIARLCGRNDGLREAAALARSVGSKSVARAIGERVDPSPGTPVARSPS